MNRKTPHKNLGIAACAISVTASGEIQLLPAGGFRAIDGRPKDVSAWLIDAALAAAIVADFEARANKTVIDYEHQTILTAQNGQPAPAAAWFSRLEWRESGLYAIDVEWTERASQMISGGEYLYISPVFTYDRKTGAVKSLINAALTNNPALDGMDAVAANRFAQLIDQQNNQEILKMEGLMEQLRWLLNLPVTATADEITAELQKALDQIKAAQPAAAASADFNIVGLIKSQTDQIAALTASASNPDPSKFVPVATMQTLQNEFSALRAQIAAREVNEVVTAALASGKILPAQEAWARDHGKENLASLKAYLETAQPIAALTGTQTNGNPPEGGAAVQLDENQLAVCRATGTAPEDFIKTLQATQAQA